MISTYIFILVCVLLSSLGLLAANEISFLREELREKTSELDALKQDYRGANDRDHC